MATEATTMTRTVDVSLRKTIMASLCQPVAMLTKMPSTTSTASGKPMGKPLLRFLVR